MLSPFIDSFVITKARIEDMLIQWRNWFDVFEIVLKKSGVAITHNKNDIQATDKTALREKSVFDVEPLVDKAFFVLPFLLQS